MISNSTFHIKTERLTEIFAEKVHPEEIPYCGTLIMVAQLLKKPQPSLKYLQFAEKLLNSAGPLTLTIHPPLDLRLLVESIEEAQAAAMSLKSPSRRCAYQLQHTIEHLYDCLATGEGSVKEAFYEFSKQWKEFTYLTLRQKIEALECVWKA